MNSNTTASPLVLPPCQNCLFYFQNSCPGIMAPSYRSKTVSLLSLIHQGGEGWLGPTAPSVLPEVPCNPTRLCPEPVISLCAPLLSAPYGIRLQVNPNFLNNYTTANLHPTSIIQMGNDPAKSLFKWLFLFSHVICMPTRIQTLEGF